MNVELATVEMTDRDLLVGGRVDVTAFSGAMQRRADCSFWVPDDASGNLPLIVLLHGVYGGHWAWLGRGAADLTARELIVRGVIPPCVLAMPSDGLIGHGSGYVRQPGADVPRWILDEVPALAHLVAPNVDPAAPLALIGLSMGGYGALRLAAVAGASRVAAAAGMSSITTLAEMTLFGVDPLPNVDDAASESVIAAVDDATHPIGGVQIVCGADDPLIEYNRTLHDELRRRSVQHQWIEDDGGHEWRYWRRHLAPALAFVAGYLAAV